MTKTKTKIKPGTLVRFLTSREAQAAGLNVAGTPSNDRARKAHGVVRWIHKGDCFDSGFARVLWLSTDEGATRLTTWLADGAVIAGSETTVELRTLTAVEE